MNTAQHRKHIPIGVRLHAALLVLGFTDEEITGGIQWDHNPPLALRILNPETGQLEPHPNDPHYISPMRTPDHRRKTSGTKATSAGSDIHAIAKVRRLQKNPTGGEEFRRKLLSKPQRHERPKSRWPKRKMNGGRK